MRSFCYGIGTLGGIDIWVPQVGNEEFGTDVGSPLASVLWLAGRCSHTGNRGSLKDTSR